MARVWIPSTSLLSNKMLESLFMVRQNWGHWGESRATQSRYWFLRHFGALEFVGVGGASLDKTIPGYNTCCSPGRGGGGGVTKTPEAADCLAVWSWASQALHFPLPVKWGEEDQMEDFCERSLMTVSFFLFLQGLRLFHSVLQHWEALVGKVHSPS